MAHLTARLEELSDQRGDAWQHAKEIVEALEVGFKNGSDEVREVIAGSFVAGLPRKGAGSRLRTWLGPELNAELQRQEDWRPPETEGF